VLLTLAGSGVAALTLMACYGSAVCRSGTGVGCGTPLPNVDLLPDGGMPHGVQYCGVPDGGTPVPCDEADGGPDAGSPDGGDLDAGP
jgi:hypothetical protein